MVKELLEEDSDQKLREVMASYASFGKLMTECAPFASQASRTPAP